MLADHGNSDYTGEMTPFASAAAEDTIALRQGRRLLLISNSMSGAGFLEHALRPIREFLGEDTADVVFVPYASVLDSFDEYTAKATAPLRAMGYAVRSLHTCADRIAALEQAGAVVVGGGNTFCLLRRLYDERLLAPIRARAAAGVPYVGWSAGANIAGPTIMTTNDMPIVWLPSPQALGLVPFQINPHYVEGNPPGFYGETRGRRLSEFAHLHPEVDVVGLPEGGSIRVEGERIDLIGCSAVTVFRGDQPPMLLTSLETLDPSAIVSTGATRAQR
jgi:dipeptidase E